jgi:hypothetical protein
LTRASNGGVYGVLAGGTAISLPPLLNFGSEYLKDKYAKPALYGKKRIPKKTFFFFFKSKN